MEFKKRKKNRFEERTILRFHFCYHLSFEKTASANVELAIF